jgi:hypothetical protein
MSIRFCWITCPALISGWFCATVAAAGHWFEQVRYCVLQLAMQVADTWLCASRTGFSPPIA